MALDFYLRQSADPNPADGRLRDGSAPVAGVQAARFDSAADTLVMPSAAVPAAGGAWTVAIWGRLVSDRNVPVMFWSFDALFSSGWHALETDSSGTDLKFYESGTNVANIATLTVGTWYFIVVRKSAGGTLKTYIGTEAGGALTTGSGAVTNFSSYAGDGYVGGSAYGDYLDGRMWGMRVWDAELSDAEVDAEFVASTAARTANLRAQWLLDAIPPTGDTSGNGRTLTNSGGSWVLETGPTLPAGGSTVTATLAGTIGLTSAVGTSHGVGAALAGTLAGPSSSVGANQVVGGIAGTLAVPTSAIGAAHGTAASIAGTLSGPVSSVGAAHGVVATLAGTLPAPTSAVSVTVNSSVVTATIAGSVPGPTSTVGAAHGVATALAGTLAGPTSSIGAALGAAAGIAGTISVSTNASASHGTSAAIAGTVPVTSSTTAAHGVTGAVAGVVSVSSSAGVDHGASASIAGVVPAPTFALNVSGVAEVLATPVVLSVNAERRVLFEDTDARRLVPQAERRALYEPADDRSLNVKRERRTLWESP